MGGVWDELKSGGYAALEGLIGTAEGLTLEFKRKASPDRPGLSDDDRRGIAETLSGMSNAVGGLLLFGVIDRKEGDLDIADSVQAICDIDNLAGRIRALCSEILTPVNNDVEVIPLTAPGTMVGVVAIRIGASDNRPHMSTAAQHRRYYLRTVGANLPMLDYQVRDMLRIATTAQLQLAYRAEHWVRTSGTEYLSITLLVENVGRISAKHAYLLVRASQEIQSIIAVENSFETFEHGDLSLRAFRSTSDQIIHPGMTVPVVRILSNVHKSKPEDEVQISFRKGKFKKAIEATLTAAISVGCENSSLSEYELSLAGSELEEVADLAVLGQYHSLRALGIRRLRRAK